MLLVPEDAAAQFTDDALQCEDIREWTVRIEVGLACALLVDNGAGDARDCAVQEPLACREEVLEIVAAQRAWSFVRDQMACEYLLELPVLERRFDLGDVDRRGLVGDSPVLSGSRSAPG